MTKEKFCKIARINNPLKLMYELCKASMEVSVYSFLLIGMTIVYIDNWEHSLMKELCNPDALHNLVIISIIMSQIFMMGFSVYKLYFCSEKNTYEVRSKIIMLTFYLILLRIFSYSGFLYLVILIYLISCCGKLSIKMYWEKL